MEPEADKFYWVQHVRSRPGEGPPHWEQSPQVARWWPNEANHPAGVKGYWLTTGDECEWLDGRDYVLIAGPIEPPLMPRPAAE